MQGGLIFIVACCVRSGVMCPSTPKRGLFFDRPPFKLPLANSPFDFIARILQAASSQEHDMSIGF